MNLLTRTSKMPWYSFSLPAQNCKLGSILRKNKNSVCSSCYALKGNYLFPAVKNALQKRLQMVETAEWVPTMINELTKKSKGKVQYFRWHDSGDIQSFSHLQKILTIVKHTPNIKHWLPTKEYSIIKNLSPIDVPPNLNIRVSYPMKGKPKVPMNTPYTVSYVDNPDVFQCPAPSQGNKCGSCRACWSPEVKEVSYNAH